jgi:hypothetical protein
MINPLGSFLQEKQNLRDLFMRHRSGTALRNMRFNMPI